jgi:hypothetical protein
MKSTERRLVRLEKRARREIEVPRVDFFIGTVEEVEARRKEVSGQNIILISPSPRVGETMDEARAITGMEPWHVDGWDTPR